MLHILNLKFIKKTNHTKYFQGLWRRRDTQELSLGILSLLLLLLLLCWMWVHCSIYKDSYSVSRLVWTITSLASEFLSE
jgi:hypothetical protein